jgi:hypothetical protein
MRNLKALSERVARLEDERGTKRQMSPELREKLEQIKRGIPTREEHMQRLEASRGR